MLLIHVSELSGPHLYFPRMSNKTRRTVLALGLSAVVLPPFAFANRHESDYDRARRAVEEGEALPLAELLFKVRDKLGGEVVGVSFERKRRRWVYEFKVIDPAGHLWEIYVDAATAEILRREED